ncbi:SDR family NAD(P)-dependent oxidoreductase [Paenibacillus pasadenensis]|uniref:SDR family NAD(P)-dependent oxidoreductase n=1 Tax=Paenibacillus pasadenensis TaxID=217090 RepID=UPI00203F2889|nr:SDR family NAD(P)-dependent oxidoreductase [Paenibacillus pasadenensis]MCM3746400.1 SDR family NAD(P)-dependent oxidoreductase [Paenibacillus pasadenensis]
MDKLYHYILKRATEGKIEKEDAVRMVTMLRQTQAELQENGKEDIAIIGMSSHIAGTDSPAEFWKSIEAGIDLTGAFPKERSADIESYLTAMLDDMGWEVKYSPGAYLHDIASFDYSFFRITPNEANLMDPSQRVFLQTAWEAVEDAGYGGKKLAGSRTGVYVGYSSSSLYHNMILDTEPEAAAAALTGNIAAMLPTRISYMLDLKGPTLILDTACSSSSVAIHLACKAIHNGDCHMALAGGIRINLLPVDNSGLKLGVEAADGRTRTFDADAEGAGWGEGSAAVLLKPLHKAVADGDRIYAVIKGTALNQDGASIGITAPNSNAQADVLQKAWHEAGIQPDTLSYIEVHGTATRLGDPLEIEGLYKAFKKHTRKKQFCAVSTLKTNVGHLYECAGIAGVIKAALSLKNRKLPASLNFNRPNAAIDFSDSPVYVNTHTRDWEAQEHPRRCGISAFGLSGTNCHIVLEEYTPAPAGQTDGDSDKNVPAQPQLLTISARSLDSLHGIISRYGQLLNREAEFPLRDLCYTANTGRGHYAHRIAIICEDSADLKRKIALLESQPLEELVHSDILYGRHKVVSGNKQELGEGEIKESKRGELTRQAAGKLAQLADSGGTDKELLREIGCLYTGGAEVSWEELYRGQECKITDAPVYAFEKKHCWLEQPQAVSKREVKEPLLYAMEWRKCSRIPEPSALKGAAVIFMDSSGTGQRIAESFRAGGRPVIEIELADEASPACTALGQRYRINGSKEGYLLLLQQLKDVSVSQIIHLFALDAQDASGSLETLKERQQRSGAYSLWYLTRALAAAAADNREQLALHIVTRTTVRASGEEKQLIPDYAPLHGMGKAIPKELPGVSVKIIDLDGNVPVSGLMNELQAADGTYAVALRGGDRYTEVFAELSNVTEDASPVTLQKQGVYLITGGLGGIGLEVAKRFAAAGKVNLALLNRTPLPPRAQWQAILGNGDGGSADKLKKRLRSLLELESLGANVDCFSVDIADYAAMAKVMAGLKSSYGSIRGIVHGAGVSSDGPLADRSEGMFEAIYAPKVYGTWVLDHLTREEELDFFILFSSVATIFTARGQGDYAAANAYLDAYASYRRDGRGRTVSVNWTTWKETGMAFDGGHVFDTIFKTLPTELGLDGLSLLLRQEADRALVGHIHYDGAGAMLLERSGVAYSDLIRQRIAAKRDKKPKTGGAAEKSVRSADGVTLLGRGDGGYSELEQKLALCCKQVFGYEEIDIYDNFFEMGADSLVLMKLQGEIETHTFEAVPVSELFQHTTVAQLAEYLARRASGRGAVSTHTYPPMQKAEEKPFYPASHAQQRMFLAFKREPQTTSSNQFRVSVLHIRIEPERMELAARRLIDRHEVLRTAVMARDGEIVQVIQERADFKLAYWEAGEAEAQAIIGSFKQPFDLNAPPLFRLGLVKVEEQKYYLLYDAHHIITDGVSMEIFMRELVQLYKGETLPAPAYQYKDAVEWQLSFMQSEAMDRQRRYWLDTFADGIPLLRLPTDFERSGKLAFESGLMLRLTDQELANRLKTLAGSAGTTMYMLLLAAYAVLLSKYAAQEELVIGSPVAGRPKREMDRIVGMFINMLAMRVNPRKEMTFLDCLDEVRAGAVQAFDHQDYPLDELIYQLDMKRDASRHPMFDTVFIYQSAAAEEREMGRSLDGIYNLTDYDLTMEAMEKNGALQLRLEYNTFLFRPQTAERLLEDYAGILKAIADSPQTRLQHIELASLDRLAPEYEADEEISFNL